MIARTKKSRCLILGCSRTKNESPEPLPAVQRYDGPTYRVLRRYLGENHQDQSLDIFVLSAKYGLIDGCLNIDNYDQRMTNSRANDLHDQVMAKIQKGLLPKNYGEIFLSMGKTYLRALDGLENMVNGRTTIIISNGASGRKLTELRNWLWGKELSPKRSKEPDFVVAKITPQTAVLRGNTITMTTKEAIQHLQLGINNNTEAAHKVRSWYVDIAGEKVSPKWAAQTLFDMPVNRFSADEARRVLRRLGLNCYKQ